MATSDDDDDLMPEGYIDALIELIRGLPPADDDCDNVDIEPVY